jgi:hypothetical protein
LANERAKAHAQKRGGGQPLRPLDFDLGERHCSREPAAHETPEQAFDRQWALRLLELVEARLREEYARSGKWTTKCAAFSRHLDNGRSADLRSSGCCGAGTTSLPGPEWPTCVPSYLLINQRQRG